MKRHPHRFICQNNEMYEICLQMMRFNLYPVPLFLFLLLILFVFSSFWFSFCFILNDQNAAYKRLSLQRHYLSSITSLTSCLLLSWYISWQWSIRLQHMEKKIYHPTNIPKSDYGHKHQPVISLKIMKSLKRQASEIFG